MPLQAPASQDAGGAPVAPQTDAADQSLESTPDSAGTDASGELTPSPSGKSQPNASSVDTGDDQDRAILTRLAKEEGLDLRSQYRTDAEFLRGHKELRTALSKRDEDAAIGKLMRGREQDVLEFFKSKQQPVQPANGKAQDNPPWDGYKLLEARVIDPTTGQPRAGARPEDVQKYQSINDGLLKAAYQMAYHPKEYLAEIVKEQVAQARQDWDRELAGRASQQTENQMLATFEDQHKDWMFSNKRDDASGYTPQGYRFLDLCQEIDTTYRQLGATLPMSALERLAYESLIREQPESTPTTTAQRPQARRRASTTQKQPSFEERLRELSAKFPMEEALAQLQEEFPNQ
jgi:hypothetical protein